MPPKAPLLRTLTLSAFLIIFLPLATVAQTSPSDVPATDSAPPIVSPAGENAPDAAASGPIDLNPVLDATGSISIPAPPDDSNEPIVFEGVEDSSILPATRTTNMVILAAALNAFLEETEEQQTADIVFRAKIRAALKKAYLSCPPDFSGLVAEMQQLDQEIATATANLPAIRKEQADTARLYAEADKRGDKKESKLLLDKLMLLDSRLLEAESSAVSIHPLRLAFFESIYADYYGKTCPKNSVLLDGTFCIDTYEAPDVPGATPTVGISYREAEDYCTKQGKRLCTRDEWLRACLGPECRPNQLVMKPFDTAECNPGLNVMSDRPVQPTGAAKSCVTPEGIADLYGNAWEWTKGKYKNYYRILRGGVGYRELTPACNATAWAMPDTQLPYSGARCCADPKVNWLPNSDAIIMPETPKIEPEQPAEPVEPEEPLPTPNIQPSPGFQ